jgi:hypothetical protein
MTRLVHTSRPACGKTAAVGFALLLALGGAVSAQPFGVWTAFTGNGTSSGNGYLGIPHDPALNPTGAITIEAWVSLVPGGGQTCRSIIGKDYTQAYWVGACKQADGTNVLRSYTRGNGSRVNGGIIPSSGQWTHVAVTSDGMTRYHYINGELVGTFSEGGALTTSTAPVWIGGDVSWVYSPSGSISEVRLWNVARTIDQIRANINVHLGSPQSGLVAVWKMGGAGDSLGLFNGTFVGTEFPIAPPAIISCGSSGPASLCLQGKFEVNATFRVGAPGTAEGTAMTVGCANPGSGLFWFFDPNNWELMVKAINGCALNNKWWVFSAATTNVFYRMNVTDVQSGETKVYFNYPGPPAPAVTDTSAFPCP